MAEVRMRITECTVKQLREALDGLDDDLIVWPNTVSNLTILRHTDDGTHVTTGVIELRGQYAEPHKPGAKWEKW